jgi:hypothetical protein
MIIVETPSAAPPNLPQTRRKLQFSGHSSSKVVSDYAQQRERGRIYGKSLQ